MNANLRGGRRRLGMFMATVSVAVADREREGRLVVHGGGAPPSSLQRRRWSRVEREREEERREERRKRGVRRGGRRRMRQCQREMAAAAAAKAYDIVQWPFLLKVLRLMGFSQVWLSLVERCIGSCWFSVLINGVPSGFFKSTRGLRQGDPISPALFVIAADYLSRALDKLILGHKDMLFKSSRSSPEVSHLAYADSGSPDFFTSP